MGGTVSDQHLIRDTWVPLFTISENGVVHTKKISTTNARNIMCRSDQMESLKIREFSKLVDDWTSGSPAIKGKTKCRFHGGRSTGSKTLEGKGRQIAANTNTGSKHVRSVRNEVSS